MAYQQEDLNRGEDHAQASRHAMMLHGAHEAGRTGGAFWATQGEANVFIKDGVAFAEAGRGPDRALAVAAAPLQHIYVPHRVEVLTSKPIHRSKRTYCIVFLILAILLIIAGVVAGVVVYKTHKNSYSYY